jgi:ribosomal-protein-alanine N-acetyltransferase
MDNFLYQDLAHLHAQCFRHGWPQAAFQAYGHDPTTKLWLEKNGTQLTGFLLMRIIAPEAEILTFAVSPAFQRKGIGRKLLTQALQELTSQGIASVFLDVHEGNHAAIILYQSLGFKEIARRPDYYMETENLPGAAVVMLFSLG